MILGDLGENGTERQTRALTLSGLNRLRYQATTAPQSEPTTKALTFQRKEKRTKLKTSFADYRNTYITR